jgi:hypothetical protein
MNFITMLKQEHKEAKQTLETLLSAEEIDRKEAEELCETLLLHMEMEELYFYPVMESFKETEELSEEAELEHTEAKKIIRALLRTQLEEVEYKVKLETLQLEIVHHIEEEESELLPLAQKKLADEQIKQISEQMLTLKTKKQSASAR